MGGAKLSWTSVVPVSSCGVPRSDALLRVACSAVRVIISKSSTTQARGLCASQASVARRDQHV